MKKLMLILMTLIMCASMVGLVACGSNTENKEPTTTVSPATTTPAETTPATEAPGAKPTIKIGYLNWGSAQFGASLAKIIIEKGYGYPVEFTEGATIPLFQAVTTGDIDVDMEVWLPNQQEAYDQAVANGDVVPLSLLNNDNWQSSFVVPTYVIKGDSERGIDPMAPDLKTVQDLVNYVDLFENPENHGKGLLLNGPAGWEAEKVTPKQVEAYGLSDYYDVVGAGSQEGLFASLSSAYDKGEPWLGYLWGPTWIAGKLDLTRLEEPAYDPDIWKQNNACAWPSANLEVVANKGFADKAPDVVEMLKNWKLDTSILNSVLAYMDVTGGTPSDTALWFIKNREDIWTAFVPADIAAKIKAAVAEM